MRSVTHRINRKNPMKSIAKSIKTLDTLTSIKYLKYYIIYSMAHSALAMRYESLELVCMFYIPFIGESVFNEIRSASRV